VNKEVLFCNSGRAVLLITVLNIALLLENYRFEFAQLQQVLSTRRKYHLEISGGEIPCGKLYTVTHLAEFS
jgi:hypothetical protein